MPQISQFDKFSRQRIVFGPALSEPLIHLWVKETIILRLYLFVSFEYNSNEQLQKDQADKEHKRYQIHWSASEAPAPHSLIPVISVIFETRILYALICRALRRGKWHKIVIPRIYCRHCKKSDKRTSETLKVDIIIHSWIPFELPEVYHPYDRIYVHH